MRAATIASVLVLVGCASVPVVDDSFRQRAALDHELPETGAPSFESGTGPRVGIDEAHNNFHTAAGRYRPFASLLRRDGYQVGGFSEQFNAESLEEIELLVVSNAISERNVESWALPNGSAFTSEEIRGVESWVAAGGRLLLIADHMPMPGAAAALAAAFGVLFHDGFAYPADGDSRLHFRLAEGTLAAHQVTRSPGGQAVESVVTFTGQAFRVLDGVDVDPLMILPEGSYMLLPSIAWEFDETTPRIPAAGLLQGALIRHGAGRVAVFGEAAAFSAQVLERDGEVVGLAGVNHPDAVDNAAFLLNVVRWLVGEDDH